MNQRRDFLAHSGVGLISGLVLSSKAMAQEPAKQSRVASEPLVVNANDKTPVWAMGIRVTVMVTAEETDGAYSVFEDIIPPGGGPPPHTHSREDETIFVMQGELRAWLGGVRYDVKAGDFVHMPRGVQHYFKNVSDRPTKMLLTYTPGGFEEWFEIVGKPVEGDSMAPPELERADLQRAVAAAATFGVKFAPKHQ